MRDKEMEKSGRPSFTKRADWSRINFTFLVFVLGIKTVFCILLFIYQHVLLFFIFFMSTVISLYSLVVNTFKALTLYIIILTSILTSIFLSLFNIIHVEYISNVFKDVFLSTVSYSVLPLFTLEFFVAVIYICLKRRRRGYIEKRLKELKIIIDGGRNKEKGEKLLSLQIDLEKNELNTYDRTYKYYLTNYKNKKYICIEKNTDYSSDGDDQSAHHGGNEYVDYNATSSKRSSLKKHRSSSGKKSLQAEKIANKGSPKSDSLSYYHVSEDLSFIHSGIKKYAKKNEKSNAKKKKSGGKGPAEKYTHTAGTWSDGYGSPMHSASSHTKGRKHQWCNDKNSITDKECTNLVNNEREDEAEGTSIISQEPPSQTQFLTQQIEPCSNKTMSNSLTETLPNQTPEEGENSKKGSAEYIKNSFSLDNYEEVNHIIEKFIEKNKKEETPSADSTFDSTKQTEQQNGAEDTVEKVDELDMESKKRKMDDDLEQKELPQNETPPGSFDPTPLPNVQNQTEEMNVHNDEEKWDHLLGRMTSQVEEELINILTTQGCDQKEEIYAECTVEEKNADQLAYVEDHHDEIVAKFEAQQYNQGDELHSTVSEMEENKKKQSDDKEVDLNNISDRMDNPVCSGTADMEEETKQVDKTNNQELSMGEQYDNFKKEEIDAQENYQREVIPVISSTNQACEHTGKVTTIHDGESHLEVQQQMEEQSDEQWNGIPTEHPSELPSGESSQLHIEQVTALPSSPASNMPNGKEEKDDGDEDKGDNSSESKKTHEDEEQVKNFLCTNLEDINLLKSANYEVDTKEWIKLEKEDIEMLKRSVNIDNIEHIPIDDFYTKNIKERGSNLFSYSIHSSNMSEFLKIGVDQKACASWSAQQEESLTSTDDIYKKINFSNLENNKKCYVTLFSEEVIPAGVLNEKEKITECMNLQQMETFHLDCNEMDSGNESSHVEEAKETSETHPSNDFKSGEDSDQKCSQEKVLDHGKEKESNEKGLYPFEQMNISSNAFTSNLYTTEHGEYRNYEEVMKDNSNIAEAFLNSGMYGEKSEMGKSNISDEILPNSFINPNENIILNYSSCNDGMQSVPNSSLILVKGEQGTKESENSTRIFNRGSDSNSGNINDPTKCMDNKDMNKEQEDTRNMGSNGMCESTSIFKQRKSFFENLKKDKPLSSHPAKIFLSNERDVLRKVSGKSEGEVLNSNSSINQRKEGNIPVAESNMSSSIPNEEDNQTNKEHSLEKFAKLKKTKNISDNFYIINDKMKSSGKEKKDTSLMGIAPSEQLTPSNDLEGRTTTDTLNTPNRDKENEMEKIECMDEMANCESNKKITQHFVIYDQSDFATPSTKLDEGTLTMGEAHNLEKKKKIEGTTPNTVITLNNCTINSNADMHITEGKKYMFSSATQLSKDIFINLEKVEKIIHDVKNESSYHEVSLLSQVKEVPTFGSSEEPNPQNKKKKFTELKKKTTPMNSNPINDTFPAEATNSKINEFPDMNLDHTKEVLPSGHISIGVMNSEASPCSGDLLSPADKSLLTVSAPVDKFEDEFFNMNSCDSSVMYKDFMDVMNSEVRPEVEHLEEAEVDAVPELVEVIPEQMEVFSEPMEATSKSVEASPQQPDNNLPHGTLNSAEEEGDAKSEEEPKSRGENDAALESENIHELNSLPPQEAQLGMGQTDLMRNSNHSFDVSFGVHTDKHKMDDKNSLIDNLKENEAIDTAGDLKENYTNEKCTNNDADQQPFINDKVEGEDKPNEELTGKVTLQEELITKDNFEEDETESIYPNEEDSPVGNAAIYESNGIPPLKERNEDIISLPTEQVIDNLENVIDPPMVEENTGGDKPKEEISPDEEHSGGEIIDNNNHVNVSEKAEAGVSESPNSSKLNQEKTKNYRNRKYSKRRNRRR
ncbi:conserved Plasmodium protein, unknown function [Plasmodium knowlesi strain H]|uniref:Uncharacterized protein n=3 Tax=Plasmodium knowlesi TaxID=5850 RepID=A0A5K1VCF3_PLAKH|nr:conserved Plasmodium protein, unknown function [Plasmodium knowlesi strain H]OTN68718.1 Uncharacterized protein PKNOH_S01010800 [Plasmodium knowlesi]CAA9986109.1 conserved Plasmodium protein, unknown function [Plasmodium knowlesi strain H]SBO25272.1 conserved Plasmodium protein, unknown function [Plasmodium knowlesi strain H]SBO27605.1 conserved Plasmodium protein, unknown function [Plasmodium knowlesi strain H]VVS75583.1 conserved Plasmodium protein, unknown function [Plasmodium knowlesi s|eukprot:XP_002257520.1 hypothetical protein, conserved in Plasmodium species [Plasmodium knowlesi strain H]